MVRTIKLTALVSFAVLFPLTVGARVVHPMVALNITNPVPNQKVMVRQPVSGEAAVGITKVWLIIHPLENDDCWAQGPAIVNSNRSWQMIGQFGEVGAEHSGKPYEVHAIANPRTPLKPGQVSCNFSARFYSDSVDVVRN